MQVSYKRDMNHNYLILDPEEQIYGSEYQIRMLSMNDIRGLLKCNMKKMDGKVYFYYEVTSKQSLERIFEKSTMTMDDIKTLLLGVKSSIENVAAYLLEPDHVLLDPSYIYMDIETKEPCLCYLPSYKGSITSSFKELAEFILKRLDHNDHGAVSLGYDIYRQTTEENFSIEQIIQSVYRVQTSSDLRLSRKSGQPGEPDVNAELTSKASKSVKAEMNQKEELEESPFIDTTDAELKRQILGEKEDGKVKEKSGQKRDKNKEIKNKDIKVKERKVKEVKKNNEVKGKHDKSSYYNRKEDGKNKPGREIRGSHKICDMVNFKLNFFIITVTAAIIGGIFAAGSYLEADMTLLGGIVFSVLGGAGYFTSFINRKKLNKNEKQIKGNSDIDNIAEFLEEDENDIEAGVISGMEAAFRPDMQLRSQTKIEEGYQAEKEEQIGQTTILCGDEELKKLCFISMEPHLRGNILLYDKTLYIGKMKSKVDVRIDLPVVSRVHAKIWQEEGSFYVMDLNSMNGTFLNGERLEANEKREIRPSDEVAFASASYYIGR